MKIVAATWFPYTLPLAQPWITSRGRRESLRGHLLRLSSDTGLVGWGDAAPLPEFGISAADAQRLARETAVLDLCAQTRQIPLHALLRQQPVLSHLKTHCNLGDLGRINADRLQSFTREAAPALKIKVGVMPWHDEIDRLQHLIPGLPSASRLRLDANQAWDFASAQAFIDACTERLFPIESIEEPLQASTEPARFHAQLYALQQRCSFPLAVDESAPLIDHAFLLKPPVQRIVIKPARHGGLLGALHLARQAQAAGLDCLVTSALESGCGLLACAHLAAAIDPTAIHGLHLPQLRGSPLRPEIDRPRFDLPTGPGLGFPARPPDRTSLRQ